MAGKKWMLFLYILPLIGVFVFSYITHLTTENKIAALSGKIINLEDMLFKLQVDLEEAQGIMEDVQKSVAEIEDNLFEVREVFQQTQNLRDYIARFQPRINPEKKAEISYALVYYARVHELDPHLVAAVVEAESSFSPRAVSPKGAKGLMQLMPGTARMLGVRDPFDIRQNISGGTRYLAMLYERFEDWDLALAAYHAGPGRVLMYRGIPPFSGDKSLLNQGKQKLHPVGWRIAQG